MPTSQAKKIGGLKAQKLTLGKRRLSGREAAERQFRHMGADEKAKAPQQQEKK